MRTAVSLVVADSGPGIPLDIQTRIFEPFFTTKPLGEGTGLGLSLCQGIVASHGGSIQVQSEPGKGATFRIEFPVGARAPRSPRVQPSDVVPVRGKKLLVADDEPEVAAVLTELVAVDGHEVDSVPNGAEALAKVRAQTYDLIVSDLKMPVLDGRAFYRELERRHPHLCRRVVFTTGDTVDSDLRAFLEQTGAPTLSKPFRLDEIRRLVQTTVAEAEAHR